MRPETPADAGRATPPPRQSPVPSGAGKSPSSLQGGNTSSGRATPKPTNSRAEEEFFSPPDHQDTGASDMGAGSDVAGRSEPLVPPVQEKKKKNTTASPSKASAATAPLAKSAAAPTPVATGKAPAAPLQSSPEGTVVTTEHLTAAVKAATAPGSSSQAQPRAQSLVLHTGRAAVAAGEKAASQLGRIVELTHGGASLGALQ
jgi:hypothetical protein